MMSFIYLKIIAILAIIVWGIIKASVTKPNLVPVAQALTSGQAPVLFLRNFNVDEHGPGDDIARGIHQGISFEKLLEIEVKIIGPMIALADPTITGPLSGAHRERVTDEEWKNKVLDYMRMAALIILMPSHSPGVLWEIEQIIKNGYLGKTIFYMQIGLINETIMQKAQYNIFRRNTSYLFPKPLPEYSSSKKYLHFDDAKNPVQYAQLIQIPFYVKLIVNN